jgi:CRISPR-associated endonuclease/helicase Cas3
MFLTSAHFAHSRMPGDQRLWQELHQHLQESAALASRLAPSGLRELAHLGGLWHDVGKYQAEFQRYIGVDPEASNESRSKPRSVPHSGAGAALALECFGLRDPRSLALALVIEAHHGSLKALHEVEAVLSERGAPLLARALAGGLPEALIAAGKAVPDVPSWCFSGLGIRMLFSSLVDADLLNTEAWDHGKQRARTSDTISELALRLEKACSAKCRRDTPLAAMRTDVYNACVNSAAQPRGGYTLTVPTGGGKTLSGLAFSLCHAATWKMDRVIVVAPYTAILEQTAQVYRDILGDENVIEHHSNLDLQLDTDRNRRASENWDAPIVVTTSIQFFESLYAAHKRPCRKLHSIANSVVLLDEVQTFPPGLLQPIHAILKLLTEHFGVTVVHSTATQPLLGSGKEVFPHASQMPLRQIVTDFVEHFKVVAHRFKMHRLGNLGAPVTLEELGREIALHPTALVIVHKRDEARKLAGLLGAECLHLSALLCAEHRSVVLAEVRQRLMGQRPCVLVATQLVEAGVDIDFPVVFRALAGLETLAQAAGRCNREMKGVDPGRFVVFRAPSEPPKGSLSLGMRVALDSYFSVGDPDLNDPNLFPKYAREVLRMEETDSQMVMEAERRLDFPAVAERFRMIEDAGVSVVAPFGRAAEHIATLRQAGANRKTFRALQRFIVSLHAQEFEKLYKLGYLEPVFRQADISSPATRAEVLWMVGAGMGSQVYDERFGFSATQPPIVLTI